MKKTHYQTLQVEVDANTVIIDTSFRRLAKEYHPDYNRSNSAMGMMQDLNLAYSILRDREKRRVYDSALRAKAPSGMERFGDRYRNAAFLVCLIVLTGLIFQFVNPSFSSSAAFAKPFEIAQNFELSMPQIHLPQQEEPRSEPKATKEPEPQPVRILYDNSTSSVVVVDESIGEAAADSGTSSDDTAGNGQDATHSANENLVVPANNAGETSARKPETADKPDEEPLVERVIEPTSEAYQLNLVPVLRVAAGTNETQTKSPVLPTSTPAPTPIPTPTQTPEPPLVLNAAPAQAPQVQPITEPNLASQQLVVQQGAVQVVPLEPLTNLAPQDLPVQVLPAQHGSIQLLNPADGINGRKYQTFEWATDVVPATNQGFELIFWRPEQDPMASGFGLAAPTTDTSITVNLDELDVTLGSLLDWGHFRWGVLLVQKEPYHRIAILGQNGQPQTRAFLFTNYKSPQHQAESRGATAQGSP